MIVFYYELSLPLSKTGNLKQSGVTPTCCCTKRDCCYCFESSSIITKIKLDIQYYYFLMAIGRLIHHCYDRYYRIYWLSVITLIFYYLFLRNIYIYYDIDKKEYVMENTLQL